MLSELIRQIMKRQIKQLLILITLLIFIVSCNKENTTKQFNPFYMMTVNGDKKTIGACGTSAHVAQYLKDTAIFSAFGCGGERAGFFIKGQVKDGTYVLDNNHKAWYDLGSASYETDSTNKGTITIKSGNYQAIGGHIPFIEGEFTFNAIDKNTGQKIKVTNGKYLLEKY